jgi:hypothetical protein
MFSNNLIEFIGDKDYINNNKDILPTPSKLNIPEWFKKLDHSREKFTVKGCMPFLDSLTAGYILKLPTDIEFKKIKEGDNKKIFVRIANNEWVTNSEETYNKDLHIVQQVEGSPAIEQNGKLPFFKILNPWKIVTPSGYSCLFTNVLNNNLNDFEIFSGIVDTDCFTDRVNFPIVWKNVKDNYFLKRGSPYVQVIPFKREKWNMVITPKDTRNDALGYRTSFINNYKNRFWNKKSWK